MSAPVSTCRSSRPITWVFMVAAASAAVCRACAATSCAASEAFDTTSPAPLRRDPPRVPRADSKS
ncbi:MAG: hypothetical protein C3F17_16355 [Bradyrhizobiaceae bacterium]|nr:MAG: hypothetical protein C3F17_16355 [Bradyrhizobiaceae bacterium]